MKPLNCAISVALIVAALVLTTRADDGNHTADSKPEKSTRVAYLGVTAKPVDDTLRSQLTLPDGVGLTVVTVDHKGPSAGEIQPNDVIEKLTINC